MKKIATFFLITLFLGVSCHTTDSDEKKTAPENSEKRVIFDTDTNNELDDQHALAYLLFNRDVFDVEGITVNATVNGGSVDKHYAEARRVMKMCRSYPEVPLHKGANGTFEEIKDDLDKDDFDGSQAVDFIIEQAMQEEQEKLILLPVGKLTNIALALKKQPSISEQVRVIWLGSNYPKPGEYNQNADPAALNYILNTPVPFEMVTVRYGQPSGTAAVKVTKSQILNKMPGLGVQVESPVKGRHGGSFTNFGDYSVSLFKNYKMSGDPPSRPLFDMAAVAIVKNPDWAESKEIPAPALKNGKWQDRPDNQRTIVIWENFQKDRILSDFFETMNSPALSR